MCSAQAGSALCNDYAQEQQQLLFTEEKLGSEQCSLQFYLNYKLMQVTQPHKVPQVVLLQYVSHLKHAKTGHRA